MKVLLVLSAVHKIKRLTRAEFDKLNKSEQQQYLEEYPHSSFKDDELSLKNVGLDNSHRAEGTN